MGFVDMAKDSRVPRAIMGWVIGCVVIGRLGSIWQGWGSPHFETISGVVCIRLCPASLLNLRRSIELGECVVEACVVLVVDQEGLRVAPWLLPRLDEVRRCLVRKGLLRVCVVHVCVVLVGDHVRLGVAPVLLPRLDEVRRSLVRKGRLRGCVACVRDVLAVDRGHVRPGAVPLLLLVLNEGRRNLLKMGLFLNKARMRQCRIAGWRKARLVHRILLGVTSLVVDYVRLRADPLLLRVLDVGSRALLRISLLLGKA